MGNRVIAYAVIASVACFTFLSWTCRDASPGYLQEPTTAKPSNVPRASTAKPASISGWKLKNTCGFPLRVLYFVHTAPDHFYRRRVLRDTIGNPAVAAFVNSTIVFFVGKTSNAEVSEEVRAEAECEGDLVLLDHMSSSIIVNVFLLAYYVERHMRADNRNSRTIHCATIPYLKPIREKKYKWFVSKKEYANDTYPPYCCGAAYLMKASVLALLGEATRRVPSFCVDDVYSTGLLSNATNVTLVNIGGMCDNFPSVETTAVRKKTLFLHWGQKPVLFSKVYRFWASVLRQNRTT
ncbi:hypothetical protein MTO96_023697 [Rhipicephalus appendiculatus]